MPDKRWIAVPAAAALGLSLVAGGAVASGVTAAKVTHKAKVSADPNGDIKFTKTKLTVKHGKVTITMKNPKGTGSPHGIAVKGHGVKKKGKIVDPGHKSVLHVKLKKKGKYTFYCPFDGHLFLGMKGKLVVK